MTRRLFFKLLLTVTGVLALAGLGAERLVSRITADNFRSDLREALREKAQLAQLMIEAGPLADSQPAVDQIAARAEARVTVIRSDGTVVAESDAVASEMENHSDRPEFQSALRGEEGFSVRYSTTVGAEMMYLALPTAGGVLRLALPLSAIDARVGEIQGQIVQMVLLALLPAILLSTWIARRFSNRLSKVISYSEQLASGDFDSELEHTGSDEIGRLEGTLQSTGGQLRSMFEQLQDERSRFAAAVNGIGDGILVVDRKLRTVLANPAMDQLFSAPNRLEKGVSIKEWPRPEIPEMFTEVLETGEPRATDLHLTEPTERAWKVSSAPILSKKGKVQAVVAVFYDITEIERVDRMRKDFVINVSHELRTPLAAIQGYAETLLEGAIDEPGTNRRFLRILSQNAERLSQLTSDLMTLSQIEVNTREFDFQPRSVGELLSQSTDVIRKIAEKKSIEVQVAEADPELKIECDAGAIHQILTNLLENAAKYTPDGGRIEVGGRRLNGRVQIYVRDNGIGIAAEHIPRLFERFYRVDKARSRELGGTGLGLAIVKHLVMAHHGSVRVESEPGRGSTFSVELPVIQTQQGLLRPEQLQGSLF